MIREVKRLSQGHTAWWAAKPGFEPRSNTSAFPTVSQFWLFIKENNQILIQPNTNTIPMIIYNVLLILLMVYNAINQKRKKQDLSDRGNLFWALLHQVTRANVHLSSTCGECTRSTLQGFNPHNPLGGKYSYSPVTEEDTKAQKGQLTCPKSHNWLVATLEICPSDLSFPRYCDCNWCYFRFHLVWIFEMKHLQ